MLLSSDNKESPGLRAAAAPAGGERFNPSVSYDGVERSPRAGGVAASSCTLASYQDAFALQVLLSACLACRWRCRAATETHRAEEDGESDGVDTSAGGMKPVATTTTNVSFCHAGGTRAHGWAHGRQHEGYR